MKPYSALLLDRDGTLNAMVLNPRGTQDSPYFVSQMELYPGLASFLLPWVRAKIPIFIVTNQPGIAKGNFSRLDLDNFHQVLKDNLESQGIPIKEIIACTHHPVGSSTGDKSLISSCECRKPKPGMILSLQKKYVFDLSKAVYIGDSNVDLEAATAAGVGLHFLVRTFVSNLVPEDKRIISFPKAPSLTEVFNQLNAALK
jgi:D-glycero-D-manno-heptose 1,7-bisphosphate phosphatase